jgi:hypothetical protein
VTARRTNGVMVRFSDDETRPAWTSCGPAALPGPPSFGQLLQEPPSGNEVATRTEALAILTRLGRDGRTTAAIALERALQGAQDSASELEDFLRSE